MTDFIPVSWADDEDITAAKLNQMTSNDIYLEEHTLPQSYSYLGLAKNDGLKMACGVEAIGPSSAREITHSVQFPRGHFTYQSRPVVTATLATVGPNRMFVVIRGNNPSSARPDDTGFTVILNSDPLDLKSTNFNPRTVHVHWIAIGY